MSKSTYHIVLVLPHRYSDYIDYWVNDRKENDQGEKLHPALLAVTITIEAKNKREAESLASKSHPGHTVDSKATKRLGN